MIAIGFNPAPTALTPIPLSATDGSYTLTLTDSQPVIPNNSGGLGIEVEGVAVAMEPGQTVSVEGAEIAIGGNTGYSVNVTCNAPHGNATFTSITVTGLPSGVTATVDLNTAPGASTITFLVAADAVPGDYSYTLTAQISDESASGWPYPAITGTITLGDSPFNYYATQGNFGIIAEGYETSPNPGTAVAILYPIYLSGFPDTAQLDLSAVASDPGLTVSGPFADPAGTTPGYLGIGTPPPGVSYSPYVFFHIGAISAMPAGGATITYQATCDQVPGAVNTAVQPVSFTVSVPNPGTVYLPATLTIGPAWPPPQVLSSGGGLSLTTSEYVFSIKQGDSIDIDIFLEGFTGFTGITSFELGQLSGPGRIASPFQGGTIWCVFPSNAKAATYTPTPGTPTLITTATLTTALVTPPGIYAFTLGNGFTPPGVYASLNVQILPADVPTLATPGTLLSGTMPNLLSSSRRAQTGLVATSHQGRQVFRALVMPTQRRTPPQIMARQRHMAITNAQALQSDEIIEAWSTAAALFPGHDLIPRIIFGGVGEMTTFLPMTPLQFQYMCQQTQMAFGNPPTTLPAPVVPPNALAPGASGPWFPEAMSTSAHAVYDSDYQCNGFFLTYYYLPVGSTFGGYDPNFILPNGWIISATAVGSTAKSAASGSGFVVLGYYIGWPTPAQLLADWIAAYGDLPDNGRLYFSIRPADPVVGVTGMVMTCGLSFANGTLRGFLRPAVGQTFASEPQAWFGPLFTFAAQGAGYYLAGAPAQGGGGWTAGDPYSGTVTFKYWTKKGYPKLPPGVELTFDPDSVTIDAGDTTLKFIGGTLTVPDGTPLTTTRLGVEATDGVSTLSVTIHNLTFGDGAPAPSGFILSPYCPILTIARSHQQTITFTVSNYGASSVLLQVNHSLIHTGVTCTESTGSLTVPAASGGYAGTATFTGTFTVAADAAPGTYLFQVYVDGLDGTSSIWGDVVVT